jgi:hypothetical protein
MPRKSGHVIVGIIGPEVIEQKKRIEFLDLVVAENAGEPDTGAVNSALAGND